MPAIRSPEFLESRLTRGSSQLEVYPVNYTVVSDDAVSIRTVVLENDASSIHTMLPSCARHDQQINRPPSPTPTYHTVDPQANRPPSPTPTYHTVDLQVNRPPSLTPTYHTVDGQQPNLPPSPSQRDNGQDVKTRAARGVCEMVELPLPEKRVDVRTKGASGWTALRSAAVRRHETVIRQLLEKPAVRLLLKNGFDITAKNFDEVKALHWAASGGHEAVVRLLLEKGANADAEGFNGQTALYWAAYNGYEAVVQLLLKKGANVDMKGPEGCTAL
jgi:hypothetical protein